MGCLVQRGTIKGAVEIEPACYGRNRIVENTEASEPARPTITMLPSGSNATSWPLDAFAGSVSTRPFPNVWSMLPFVL